MKAHEQHSQRAGPTEMGTSKENPTLMKTEQAQLKIKHSYIFNGVTVLLQCAAGVVIVDVGSRHTLMLSQELEL